MYKVLNEPPKQVLGVSIDAHYTLPGVEAAVTSVAAIAHFSLRD